MIKLTMVSRLLVLTALLLSLTSTASAGVNQWTSVGPAGFQVFDLAIDPLTPTTIYGATNKGVLRSLDGGVSWTLSLNNAVVRSLVIDPATPATLYAGKDVGGMSKSLDAIVSWAGVNNGPGGSQVLALAIVPQTDPQVAAVLYAGVSGTGGVYQSKNGGNTWVAYNSGLTSGTAIQAIAIDPVNPNTLYIGGPGGGVFKKIGGSWVSKSVGIPTGVIASLAIDPINTSTVYAGTGAGVYKSTDGGASWTAINTGISVGTINALAIDPVTPSTLYAGAMSGSVYKSINGGVNWVKMSSAAVTNTIFALAIDPANPGILYAGSNGKGVLKYVTGGADTTPPVIVLTGGNINVVQGGTFIEPGFSATDNPGAVNLTGSVIVTGGPVNTDAAVGTVFTLKYVVSDAAGNPAIQKTRTVTIAVIGQAIVVTPQIVAGLGYTVALKNDGTVVAWGRNNFGQTTIPGGLLTNVIAINAGLYHTVALKNDGTVVAWGYNFYGETTIPAGLTGVTAIDAGTYHSVGLKNDGTVVAWGRNIEGQAAIPAGLIGVSAIAAGGWHTVALKSDGTVVAWGLSSFGQTTIPAGLTGVTAIAAGGYHTVALKSDGTVVAWGRNSFGQTTIPTGLTGVTAIAAGDNYTVALKSDGTVVAWGRNSFGQTTIPAGLTGVAAVDAGRYHAVALKSDGTVVAWGANTYGETTIPTGLTLGTAPVNQSPVPTAPTISTAFATAGTSQVAANDPNAGDAFTYAVSTAALNGIATVNVTGLASYTPSTGFSGTDSFVVTVTDNGIPQMSGTVTINVRVAATPAVNPLLMLSMGDVNGNGSGDFAVLGQRKASGRYVIRVKDVNTVPALIREIGLNGAYKPVQMVRLPDMNGNGSPEIAVLEVDPVSGLNRQIQVKDSRTGAKIVNIRVKTSVKPHMLVALPDVNGNGSADLALSEVHATSGKNVQIQVKDGRTGALIKNIRVNTSVKPHTLVSLGLINGKPALALSEVHATSGKNVQIQVKNAFSGAKIVNVRVQTAVKPHMLVALPDVNGNGSPDLALSEVDAVTGKNVQIQVKDGRTGALIQNIRMNTSLKPHRLVSVGNINGAPALALSEVHATTGKVVQIQVKNARTGAKVRNVAMNRNYKPHELIVLADINGNGSPELALSEVHATTGKNVQVQVKDAQTGARIRNIPMNPNYTPLGMDTSPDSNGNGVAEIGLLEVNGAGSVQIQVKDALTGGLITNLKYPNF